VRPRTPFPCILACLALIPGAAAGAAGPVYIPIISKGIHQQFWQDIMQGALKASRDYNVVVTFDGPENASLVGAQVDQLSAILEKKPSAVCIDALDSAAVMPLLEAARKDKVPVIAFDAGVDSSIPVTTAATDNFAAAELAASKLAALVGGSGKIGLIGLDQASRSGRDRRDGFLAAMKKWHPGIAIIGPEYSGGDPLKAADIAKAMIQANPDIRGFFGASDGTALGIVKGVQDAGADPRPVVVGFDSGKAQVDAIRSGLIAGAVIQDPIRIGYKAVEAAVRILRGDKVPRTIDTGFHWYDQANMDDPSMAALLYE
jgi:ribose transport system substrate-binding protein